MITRIQQNQSSFVRRSQFSDFLVHKVSYDSYRVSAAKMNHVKPFNLFLGRKQELPVARIHAYARLSHAVIKIFIV